MAASPSPELAAPPPAATTPSPYVVEAKRRETHDTWTLTLSPLDGDGFPTGPGQFTMLYPFGAGEVPISVSGPGEGPLVHTIRVAGAATRALCAQGPGDAVGVRGPYGNTWPVERALGGDLVVAAGGIGLAPLRPVLLRAILERRRFERVILLYGARTPADVLYPDSFGAWREQGIEVHVTVDAADAGWRGRTGLVTALVPAARLDAANVTAFLCGPEVMMRFTGRALEDAGVARDRIWVSLERNMRCGVGLCGHCQLGPKLICRDGAVFPLAEAMPLMEVPEL